MSVILCSSICTCSKKGEKPWTTRWFVFDGRSLKYFRSQNDKVCQCMMCGESMCGECVEYILYVWGSNRYWAVENGVQYGYVLSACTVLVCYSSCSREKLAVCCLLYFC